jgi:uncharacterized protein (DUF924 family)
MSTHADDVLNFWFDGTRQRPQWFRKDDAFDATIHERFGALIDQALQGGIDAWHDSSDEHAVARVVVLDQFTRNVHRGTPKAFAGDARALAASRALVAVGRDSKLTGVQRSFVYLPFEHSESLADQDTAVALFEGLARDEPETDLVEWARRHRDVIQRFGRFPHRNAILGRASTDLEVVFLAQPGSSF